MEKFAGKIVVVFDGKCVLCHQIYKLLRKIDRGKLLYSTLNSEFSQKVLSENPTLKQLDSILVVQTANLKKTNIFTKSKAVLQVFSQIGGIWRFLTILKILPSSLLDRIYDFIARKRYQWFGKNKEEFVCELPAEKDKKKLLD